MNERFSYGDDAIDTTHYETSNNQINISFFNPDEEPKVINQINSIISNLANIKDCLKQKLEKRGDSSQAIENEINNSLCLQIIVDLANQEKHGYPLKRRRSQKDPLIKNVSRALMPSNKPDNIRYERSDGSAVMNVMTSITAEIVDSEGNLLCRLDDLVEKSINDWNQIIKKYNIA